jgi:hypothetical protein
MPTLSFIFGIAVTERGGAEGAEGTEGAEGIEGTEGTSGNYKQWVQI